MIQKATKEKTKLRLAMHGPSGSGKTFSGLRIATGLGGKIGVICTERRRARLYSNRFSFDVIDLESYTIDAYKKAIREFEMGGYDVLFIDSISHEWQQLCIENDKLAEKKFRGNTWAAWSDSTPRHQDFVSTIMAYPGHIICSMRSATEWQKAPDGSSKPKKIGLKPEQGKNVEYEFNVLMELSMDHVATVTKDNTEIYQDKEVTKPDEEMGKRFAEWFNDGSTPENKTPKPSGKHAELIALIDKHDINDQTIMGWCAHFGVTKTTEFTDDQLTKIIDKINKKFAEQPALVA